MGTFSYAWEFRVPPEHVEAFEEAYGPQGEWVRLFQRDPSYVRTDLHRDLDVPGRYLTVDHWRSRAACLSFRERYRSEFEGIDRRCESYTEDERHLGDFDLVD